MKGKGFGLKRDIVVLFFMAMLGVMLYGKISHAEEILSIEGKVDSKGVLLSWNYDSESKEYRIERSNRSSGSFTVLATITGEKNGVVYSDESVKTGKTYYYRVTEIRQDGTEIESQVLQILATLRVPSGGLVKITKENKVKLTWKAVKDATGYEIFRSNRKETGFQSIGTSKQTNYEDTTVKSGKVYYYKISAIKKNKKSLTSEKSDGIAAYVSPDAPRVTGTYNKKKMKLTWKNVTGAEQYYIYKKNSKGKFVKLGETTKLCYTDKNVKKGKRYEYHVVAVYQKDGKMIKSKTGVCKTMATTIDPNKKMVALTFDDGPGRYTQEIVDCLKKNDAKATFFVLGCNVDAYQKSMKNADKIGCEIASHTYNHKNLTRLSAAEIRKEVKDTDAKIKKVIGKNPTLLRTPGGSFNSTVRENVGKPIILWSIDTLDWKTRNRDKTISAVVNNVQDGDIVLMHDIHKPTKEAALILIPRLKKMGYQMVTVSELAQYRNWQLKKGTVYYRLRKKK